MQLFVVGAPRSGMTIVTQFLNCHEDIKIFDEIDLIQVGRSVSVIGTLHAFLVDRGVYAAYRRYAQETADPAVALRAVMSEIARPCTIWGEKNPRYATRLGALRRSFPEAVALFVLRDPREVVNSCLVHRGSPLRTPLDFWIKDTVAEALALVESCLQPLEADAAELVVLTNQGATPGVRELAAAFERASGHKVTVVQEDGAALERRLNSNGPADLITSNPAPIEELTRKGKVVAGTATPFVLAGLGLSVRAGAAKPDIGTVAAYKAALLAAKSIGYSRGCSGTHAAEGIAELGLAETLKPKTVFTGGGPVVEYLARGDFEIGIQQPWWEPRERSMSVRCPDS